VAAWERAVAHIASRADRERDVALQRIATVATGSADAIVAATAPAGPGRSDHPVRITLNFHPDRIARGGSTVASGLAATGRYRSQWATWVSNGGRSAVPGGGRHRWERELFGGAYDDADPDVDDLPVYGALDLFRDPHGGSPRFGSSYVVLAPHVVERTTFTVGDSHTRPRDVGTWDEMTSIAAGLTEQATDGALLGRPADVGALPALLEGRVPSGPPGRVLDGYVEAQVHGGIDLLTDVEAIVLDPSFRGTRTHDLLAEAAERSGCLLGWHHGSVLAVADVPSDVRGPTMPGLARTVAGPDGVVNASRIGIAAGAIAPAPPSRRGDDDRSPAQQLKFLWHVLLARGVDAETPPDVDQPVP
jgi:hypothetical protein